MGFYGNISNTSKTTFSFDIVYPSRGAMDAAAQDDGVFLGRYVLIEYKENPIDGYYYNNNFYMTADHQEASRIKGPKRISLS